MPDGDDVSGALRRASLGPEEREVYQRLVRVAPAAAQMFMDAATLREAYASLPSMPTLVSHLVREVESSLTEMLDPEPGTRVPGPSNGAERKLERIIGYLKVDAAEPWHELMSRREGDGTRPDMLAHRRGLDGLRPADEKFNDFWTAHVRIFDLLLDLFERRASHILARIETLTDAAPSDAVAHKLASLPRDQVSMNAMFSRCETPEWLHVLREAKFFESPPGAIVDPDSGGVRYSSWPAADYLLRMSDRADTMDEVVEVLKGLPDSQNPYVYDRVLGAALRLPPAKAVQLTDQVLQGMRIGQRLPSAVELGQFVAHLANGGFVDEAFVIAAVVFELERREETLGPRVVSPSHGDWEYSEAAKQAMPALIAAHSMWAVTFALDLFERALLLASRPDADWDMSEHWRPTIETMNEGDRERGPRETLLVAARDALDAAVSRGMLGLGEAVERLIGLKRTVYKRIALYLLAQHVELDPDLAAEYAFDVANWDEPRLHYETARLLQAVFPLAPDAARVSYLASVARGPDLEDWLARFREGKRPEPTEDETADYVRSWKLQRLFPIAEHLSGADLSDYTSMMLECEEPPTWPGFAIFRVTTGWGDGTPLGAEDLSVMGIAELVEFLRSWKAKPDDFFGPSARGLAGVLQRAVEERPARYAAEAVLFVDLQCGYVEAIIQGLEQAVRKKCEFGWPPVLDFLAECAACRPHGGTEDEKVEGNQTLGASVGLLGAGLNSESNPIPPELLDAVWALLKPAFDDPNPTPEYESEFGGGNMDAYTMSINTVRGKAVHALIGLLFAKGRALGEFDIAVEERRGVRRCPELEQMLSRVLDPKLEPSLTVRAAVGSYLGTLAVLDPGWLRDAMPRILPSDDPARRDAVFDAYLLWGTMTEPGSIMLRDQYALRLSRSGAEPSAAVGERDPAESVARHIVVQYLYGTIKLDDALVTELYSPRNHEMWEAATTYVARLIDAKVEAGEALESSFVERAQRLWESRLEAATTVEGCEHLEWHKEELVNFAFWIVADVFADNWWLAQLNSVMPLVHWVEPDSLVMKRLAGVAEKEPGIAVNAATEILRGDPYGYSSLAYQDHLSTIIGAATASGDSAVAQAGMDLANRLVAKGLSEFRELADG